MGSWPGCFLAALLWLVAHGLIAWLVVKGGGLVVGPMRSFGAALLAG